MQVKGRLTFLFFLFQLALFSQQFTKEQLRKKDSLTAKLKADSTHIFRFQKYRPFFNLDQRNSFIRSAPINVNGIQLGILLHERHTLGLGGYTITQKTRQNVKTKTEKNIDVNRSLEIKYGTLFYNYAAIDTRFFELDLNVEFGAGNFILNLFDRNTDRLLLHHTGDFWVSGFGPQIAIKPLRWVGIQAMAGYRFTLGTSTNLNFNGFYYGYGLWLDIRQVIRDTRYYLIKKKRYKHEVNHLSGPAI
ncbi:MAG: hypothetical protein ACXVPN_14820 [Bacteroidia bacterium]